MRNTSFKIRIVPIVLFGIHWFKIEIEFTRNS